MNILVAGGAGFIGSHTVVALVESGHNVVILDNLQNSKYQTIENLKAITGKDIEFYKIDIRNEEEVDNIFNTIKFDGVIQLAGLKSVGESVSIPLEYYNNNLVSTMVLIKMCLQYNVNKFIFSSSATVYGDNISPFKENMEFLPTTNPYGETKAMCERILMDISRANRNFTIGILRYFNPIGAHESGIIGERPSGTPNNLMPYIIEVAERKREKLNIFGDDYGTLDGTGIRDYIHVMDLAEGHVATIERIEDGINIYNLGTGKGTSVLELVNTFQRVNDIEIPYEIIERRPGDIAVSYGDTSKAEIELGWTASRGIEEMCLDSWNFVRTTKEESEVY